MRGVKADLIGKRYGRLLVIEDMLSHDKKGNALWLCECGCGKRKIIGTWSLVDKRITSCGCKRNRRTGTAIRAKGQKVKFISSEN